ncbi:hypothetical protein HUX88_15220 [Duganella sp. BJB1802]|uniref:hypothetical protein n=1 Tax=Duganella sp. BJB1802 TaxID=2744575 RepID=UPI00159376FF|nr:hypothetical protein [Duganella sp. BJB1802]NVD71893.1 hypothetical protein [Duganella sp. BJB1802]
MNTQAAPTPKYKNSKPGWFRKRFRKVEVIHTKLTDQNEAYTIFANGELLGKVSRHTHKRIVDSTSQWFEFLNWAFGAACFVFAQGVQGTPNPPLNAGISLVWMFLLYLHQRTVKFPRLLSKDTTIDLPGDQGSLDERRKILLKALTGKYLGFFDIVRRAPFFLIGYFYLVFIATLAYGPFQNAELLGTKLSRLFLPDSCACIVKPVEDKPVTAVPKPFDPQHWTGPR